MKATETPGIWEDDTLPDGIKMICDTRLNIIRIINPNGYNVKFEYNHEIRLSDVEQIRESIIKSSIAKECNAKTIGAGE